MLFVETPINNCHTCGLRVQSTGDADWPLRCHIPQISPKLPSHPRCQPRFTRCRRPEAFLPFLLDVTMQVNASFIVSTRMIDPSLLPHFHSLQHRTEQVLSTFYYAPCLHTPAHTNSASVIIRTVFGSSDSIASLTGTSGC